jgi:NAD(P)H dehydrogenase (quinone)
MILVSAATAELGLPGVDRLLDRVFSGVDALLFMSASVTDSGRLEQHHNVVTAAADAGVGMLAYTRGSGAVLVDDGVLDDRHQTAAALRETYLDAGPRAAVLTAPNGLTKSG